MPRVVSTLPRPPKRLTGLKRLDVGEVIRVLQEEHGLMNASAERLGVSRSVLKAFITARSNVVAVLSDCREGLLDRTERRLIDLIDQGDFRAIQFVLMTVGRHRGYALPKSITALETNTTNNYTVESVNIVSVPAGHYLTAADVAAQVIDEQPLLSEENAA